MRDLEKKLLETLTGMEKLGAKVMFTEKLAYDFRKDLAKNMNEIESGFAKRLEQVARAVNEVSKMSKINCEIIQGGGSFSGRPNSGLGVYG